MGIVNKVKARMKKRKAGPFFDLLDVGSLQKEQMEEVLKSEHHLVKNIMEISPVCITVVNAKGEIIYANTQAEKTLGLTKERIISRNFNAPDWKITDFKGNPFPDEKLPFNLVRETGKPVFDVHHAIEWPGGKRIFLSINASPLWGKEGNFSGIVSSIEDITERIKAEEALLNEKRFSESIIGTAQAIILVLDPEGRIVSFNNYMEEVCGYSLQEVKGKDWFDTFLPSCDRQKNREIFKRTLSDIQTRGNVNPIITKGHELRFIDWCDKALKDNDGRVVAIISIGQDITEQRKVQETLREQEERFKTLFNSSIDAIAISDTQGHIIDCNQAYVDLLGYSKEELKKITFLELTPEKWHAANKEMIKKVMEIGYSDEFEKEYIKKDKTAVPVSLRTWKLQDKEGNFLGLCSLVRDITKRKSEQQLLIKSERLYHDLFNNASVGIIIADKETRKFLAVNPRMCKMLKMSQEEVIGSSVRDIHPDEAISKVDSHFEKLRSGESEAVTDVLIRRKDGSLFYADIYAAPITFEDKPAMIGFFNDVSDRKQVEEQVLQL
ncbi:MAG: PAS domain-containing protein, partial [Candidatus Omnitrophica bacterium]|nr:PAS domain-containing protein [Candidatus Omnitrophota bacterium]